jgi:methionine-S-sulfoxide reductase
MKKAYFAAGCFWGVEHAFRQVQGVREVISGYAGGRIARPTYKDVCAGTTGHAEAVEVLYDPTKISYKDLVLKFFSIHDPTQMNRQGPDVGTQYRSAIFYITEEERDTTEEIKKELALKVYPKTIATEITKFTNFYPAEDYHQRYFEKHPGQAICHI